MHLVKFRPKTWLGLKLGFKVYVGPDDDDWLHFFGNFFFTPPNVEVDLQMIGMWEGAFGLDKLHFGNAIAVSHKQQL